VKRRSKLHKLREVRKRRNIKSHCPIKEGFDQNVYELVLRLFRILRQSSKSIVKTYVHVHQGSGLSFSGNNNSLPSDS
jgi:hypothetical protein